MLVSVCLTAFQKQFYLLILYVIFDISANKVVNLLHALFKNSTQITPLECKIFAIVCEDKIII